MGGGFWVNGATGKTCVEAVRLIMEPIVPSTALQGTAARFLLTSGMKRIGADERARSRFAMSIRELLMEVEFISADDLIAPTRLIKSQGKRVALQRAPELTDQLFLKCLAKLKAGVMQYYTATEIDYQFVTPGAECTSFEAGVLCTAEAMDGGAKKVAP